MEFTFEGSFLSVADSCTWYLKEKQKQLYHCSERGEILQDQYNSLIGILKSLAQRFLSRLDLHKLYFCEPLSWATRTFKFLAAHKWTLN